jgi:uncharacterized protein YjbJ (UPF0337 family)
MDTFKREKKSEPKEAEMFLTERLRGIFRAMRGRGKQVTGAASGRRGKQFKGVVEEGMGRTQAGASRAAENLANPPNRRI